jgi:low temperature requirement protein LtrA
MDTQIKKVSWLELFYDLVFVALIAQLTYEVANHHTTFTDLYTVGLVGYMTFVAWWGTTVNRNLQDSEGFTDRILIQIQMLFAFLMSITLPGMFEGIVAPFFLSFAAIKALQIYMALRFHRQYPERVPKTKNVLYSIEIATLLWFLAAFAPLPFTYIVASMALMLDIFGPMTKGEGNTTIMLNVGHMQERLGLFLILVIGESMLVVALANTAAATGFERPAIVLSGIIMMIGLWWAYFHHLENCGEGKRPKSLFLYLHAHGFLFGGIVLQAAAYKNLLKHDDYVLTDHLLLVAGLIVVSGTLTIIRAMLEGSFKNLVQGRLHYAIFGIPILGYVGYYFQNSALSLGLLTLWMVLITFIDIKKRACP